MSWWYKKYLTPVSISFLPQAAPVRNLFNGADLNFLFYEKEMNLAINICICYNAIRQKEMQKFHVNKERNPRTVFQHSSGILLYFYGGKAPTRLFVALIVTVLTI